MNAIKEARQATGLSQKKAAELLEVPKSTWEQWEMEIRTPPKYVEKLIVEKLKTLEKSDN